jgi:hypothetical protein
MGRNCPTPVAAQTRTIHINEPSRRPGISFSWTRLHESYGQGSGLEIDLLLKTIKQLGIVIDGSFNNFDGFSEAALLGGVRKTLRTKAAISPFAQLLAGFERCGACGTTDPSVEPSAGVDLAISHSHTVSLRIGAGYRITPAEARTFKETHVFVGLSVRPGAR